MKIIKYILCFVLFQIFAEQVSYAQKIDSKVSTMFLFYFTKYIEWPNAKQTINLGVIAKGKDFENIKSILLKKQSSDKKINVFQLNDAKTASNFDLIFISNENANALKLCVQNCTQSNTVIVIEKIGSIKKGAGIEIYLDEDDDNKTKFVLNKKFLEAKGFKLSSQLLSLSN